MWVHLCLFKFLFSANTLLQTSHLKHWRWNLFLCLSSFFAVKTFPTPRNVTFTFLAVFHVVLKVFASLKDCFCMWDISWPLVLPSSPVLRKASVNAYPLCLRCVSLLVCCCDSIYNSNWQFCSIFSNSCHTFFLYKNTQRL